MNAENNTFTLKVSNIREVWDILNKTEITHVIDEEDMSTVVLEMYSSSDHDDMIDELREELGSRAFPDGEWPSYANRG